MQENDPGIAVDLFRPQDAQGVADLFRTVYGEEYPIKVYYDPRALTQANREGGIISSLARTGEGRVVGHNALFQNAPHPKVYESGAGLVHPDARVGGLFRDLTDHGVKVGAPLFGVETVFGEPVLNHTYSQKMVMKLGWRLMSLEVDLMPAEAYAKEKSAAGRVSTSLAFVSLVKRPHRVFLPPVYDSQLRYIYENLDDERELVPCPDSRPPAGAETRIESLVYQAAGVARLRIHQAGEDLAPRLEREVEDLAARGVKVWQAHFSLGVPHAAWMADQMRARGWFLGGVLPRWYDDDGLFMQFMRHEPGFAGMVLADDERYRRMQELVRADWQETRS